MPTDRNVIIIGTGLGGLLAGAFLAARGRRVTFLEALDITGGRFTHIDYQGFAVPTGAFHALPGGSHGPLAACCRKQGIALDVVEPNPAFMVATADKYFPIYLPLFQGRNRALRTALGIHRPGRFALRTIRYALESAFGLERPVINWMRGLSRDDRLYRVLDHLAKFCFLVPLADASMSYVLRSLSLIRRGTGEGFLRDGNRALITALLDKAQAHGAVLRTRTPVARILAEGGRAVGVETSAGERLEVSLIVSNAGASRTVNLLGEQAPACWRERLQQVRPAFGATHAIRSRERLHEHTCIELPLDLDHVAGIAPISNLCSGLCPPGWHYSLAYQVLDPEQPIGEQVEAARRELSAHFGPRAQVFNTATYYRDHPAAGVATRLGQCGTARFSPAVPGIAGLYLAGEDAVGYGFAAEVIGDSTPRLWRLLEAER